VGVALRRPVPPAVEAGLQAGDVEGGIENGAALARMTLHSR
jgi:hypothetical protein